MQQLQEFSLEELFVEHLLLKKNKKKKLRERGKKNPPNRCFVFSPFKEGGEAEILC